MRAMYKYELARKAGVSSKTFARWLKNDTDTLLSFGVLPRSKLLPPPAVKFICEKYVIDL